MTEPLNATTASLLGFCVLTDMAREVCFKGACLRADRRRYVSALALHPVLWLGLLFWAVEGLAWLLVLEHVRLAIAFPIMALTYAVTPMAAQRLLKESLTPGQRVGALLVAAGAAVVSLSDLHA